MAIFRVVDNVLRAFCREHVGGRATDGRRRAYRRGEIIMVPTTGVPPKLMDVTVGTDIIDMLRSDGLRDLRIKPVSPRNRLDGCQRRSRSSGQVEVMPAMGICPEFVYMTIGATIVHVLRTLAFEYIAGWISARQRRAGRQSQIIVMPSGDVPPEFVNVTILALVQDMLS